MTDETKAYGETVRAARRARGWTQRQLADAVGVDERTVLRIEGGRNPSPETAMGIASVLGVPIPPCHDAGHELPRLPKPADGSHQRRLATLVEAAQQLGPGVLLASDAAAFEEAHSLDAIPMAHHATSIEELLELTRLRMESTKWLLRKVGIAATFGLFYWFYTAGYLETGRWEDLNGLLYPLGLAPVIVLTFFGEHVMRWTGFGASLPVAYDAILCAIDMRNSLHAVTDAEVVVLTLVDGRVRSRRRSLKSIADVGIVDDGAHRTVTITFEGTDPVTIPWLRRDEALERALEGIEAARSALPYEVAA